MMEQGVVFHQFQGVLTLVLRVLTMQFFFSHLDPPHRMGRIPWFRHIHRNHLHSFCRLVGWPRCILPGSLVSRCRMTSLLHRKDPFHAIKKPTFEGRFFHTSYDVCDVSFHILSFGFDGCRDSLPNPC